MIKVEIVGTTKELGDDRVLLDINKDPLLLAGKAAGICYSEDGFYGKCNQNIDKVMNRAKTRGKIHQSIHDHYHINFYIEMPKFLCMLLNSINVYNTSEKSARYTLMEPETETEKDMYNKWQKISKEILTPYLNKYKTEDEIQKLAQENARYMISIWTQTAMMYTISYRNAILLVDHLLGLANIIGEYGWEEITENREYNFWRVLALESRDLAYKICKSLNIEPDKLPLKDIKNQGFRFLDNFYNSLHGKEESICDSYTLVYDMSFAGLAQAERHRTIRYSMCYIDSNLCRSFYIPFYLKGTMLEDEWTHDIEEVAKKTTPQGELVHITEQGIVEDFVLKSKERLCGRAQNEIRQVTKENMKKFAKVATDKNLNNLSMYNRSLIKDTLDSSNEPKPRCCFSDFNCQEPCYMGRNGLKNC